MKNAQRLAALGEQEAQLVIKNARVVNVFSSRIVKADIAVQDGVVVGVGHYSGKNQVDVQESYVVPGFIDGHVHFESSMVSPKRFLEQILPWGTTTIIADPHEITNVLGKKGVEYTLQETENVPANVYVMLPSCVPASSFEHNGAYFTAQEMKPLLNHPRVLGLGEVMDYPAVLSGEASMQQKLSLFAGKNIDGHAPALSGKPLSAYRLAGVCTEHECASFDEALEKLEAGFFIQVREGSGAKNLEAILSGALRMHLPLDRFFFCTDDKHLDEIRRNGHISESVKKAIGLGVDPVDAVKMATIQAARAYGLSHLGAVAPGYQADFLVLDSLEEVGIRQVYHKGALISDAAKRVSIAARPCPYEMKDTVRFAPLREEDFFMPAYRRFPVIALIKNEINTTLRYQDLPGGDRFRPQNGLLKLAVVERHKQTGNIGLGALWGLGLRRGAIATTVAHDSHNLIIAGDNDRDMLLAAQELKRCHGGYTIVADGAVLKTQPLEVAGLFSEDFDGTLLENVRQMTTLCREMGVPEGVDPFTTLSFLALPVIPQVRLLDTGVYDVTNGRWILPNKTGCV